MSRSFLSLTSCIIDVRGSSLYVNLRRPTETCRDPPRHTDTHRDTPRQTPLRALRETCGQIEAQIGSWEMIFPVSECVLSDSAP